ncbi:unnamed protein product [Caenorhabditis bovis]|uniref:Cyclin-like domain-containing protein n=1 Tax=Caenorhabditis bovis TaxID=2654633 RepID=A0A8S1END7_9PELO|nr:unnamed protein product [Caenorhabditis bovis]
MTIKYSRQEPIRRRLKKRLTSGCSAAAGKLMQDEISSAQLLQTLLHREKRLYQNFPLSLAQGDGVIGWRDRNRECAWMCASARRLGLDIDASTLAIAIFDRVIVSTKVPNKYVNCVAVACLSLAKKLCEDHEEDAPVFLGRLRLEYSASELKRMELKILEVLNWDAHLPNVYRFVEVFLSQLGAASFLLPSIRCHMETLLCDSTIVAQFRPSVLALSLVSLLVEAINRHWQHPIGAICKNAKLVMCEVSRCRVRISNLWSRRVLPMPSTFHILAEDEPMPMPRALQPTPC